jgi:hypothetical protein
MLRSTKAACFAVVIVLIALPAAWWVKSSPLRGVEAEVRARLKDPESARFTSVTWNPEKKAGCGYVNAKNSMGGYVGSKHFVLLRGGYFEFEPEDRDVGSIDERIDVARKRVKYFQMVEEFCAREAKANGEGQ